MTTFFNKFRQDFLSSGKTGKYLKYAIGEIILVVIGILIALSINNWNEARKDRNTEKQILNRILVDLMSNEEILKKSERIIEGQMNETKLFLELMRDKPVDSTFYKVKELLYESSEVEDVQLNLSGIQGVINNKIELITNDSIKRAIIEYPAILEGYKEQETSMIELKNNRIRPRIKGYIYLENFATGSTNFSNNIKELLADRTLANDFTDRKWEYNELKEDFKRLRNHGQSLIKLVKKELSQN